MNFVQPIRSIEKIEQMKKVLKKKSERNYMMFIFGINVGLRISDILQLKIRDIQGSYVIVNEKKTQKKRRFIITPWLQKEIQRYTQDKDPDDYFIKSRNGYNEPISRVQAYNILRDAAMIVGIEEIGTHTMRKTFGYHFYKKTKDIALLQEIFNHSDPSITLRYIGVNQDTVDSAMSKFKL